MRARHDAENTPPLLIALQALGTAVRKSGILGDRACCTLADVAPPGDALNHSHDLDVTYAAESLRLDYPMIPPAIS